MSTFEELRKITHCMAKDISDHTGVPHSLAINIITYARCLAPPQTPDHIDELIFTAQMNERFGITSIFHVKLMFDTLRLKEQRLVRVEDYVRLICMFSSQKLDIKIDYVFSVYDLTHDDYLDRKELTALLRPSIVSAGDETDPAEALKELIDIVLSVFDNDNDGRISLEEFRQHVKGNILYIQLLGQILPAPESLQRFLLSIKHKLPLEVRSMFESERAKSLSEPLKPRDLLLKSLYPVVLDMP